MSTEPLFPPGATADEVKAAWRDMARRLHPDAGGSAEEFHAAHEAYLEALEAAGSTDAEPPVCSVCGGKPYYLERGAHRLRVACPSCGVLA